ncbi:MAG TPA: GreA/GreB family elongation factor [Candidatus Acidoferrales bacterium]|nr:GreA/GreB family elongation factor [Candidatus Acidoferrales bacterium]
MPVRDDLPAVLRGEIGGDLSPADRDRLEAIAEVARSEKRLAWARDELGARLKQADASWGVSYVLAAVCALNGEIERAQQSLLALGEKVAAAKRWEPLAAIAERSLGLVQSHAAARLLVQAHEGLKKDPERIDALSRAWAINPDDLELALLLAKRLGEAKQDDDRRALLAELAPRFAAEARWPGLEEAALEFVEHADWDGLAQLVQTLPVVASQGALKEARVLADIATQGLAQANRAGEALEPLRKVVATAIAGGDENAAEPFRVSITAALRQGPGATVPSLDSAVAQSGLESADVPLPRAIEQFDSIAALAPGRGVLHEGFGAGRIVSNDTTTVVIDFARSRGHKMPYAAARRTLTPVAEDDLRLLRFSNPAEVKRLALEEQATLVVRALKILGGQADANRLKVFLVGSDLVAARDWTVFWRKARAAAEKDPRIDHTRAFEQVYRLAPEGAAGAAGAGRTPLPSYEVRKPARHNLGVIRKFLAQHPQAEPALKGRFGGFISRTLLDDEGERADRARAGLYFARWYPERREQWLTVLRGLWERGLAISDLASEDEQLALLADSRAAGVEAEAILSALDSRFGAVRDEAEKDRAALDDHGRLLLRRALLDHAVEYSAAVMRLIEDDFASGAPPADAWRLFLAALQLIEERPKPSTAEKVGRWLEPDGPFEKLLAGVPVTEDMRLRIRVLVRQWRSSDRLLFPALDAIGRVGLADEKQWVLEHRQRKTDKLFSQLGEQSAEADIPMMTRATWEKLKVDLAAIERELKTTIPRTIQKARELGDLKENAEYHSAKLKQSNAQKLAATLQLRIARARFVEDAEYHDGVVGLGTEVVLVRGNERTSYWILGDGEQHLGSNVISFQAPIGRSLVGRGVGDEVELGESGKGWRVESIARRLPPASAPTSIS